MRSCLTLDPGGIQRASNNLKKVAAEKEKPCWRALGKLLPQVATWPLALHHLVPAQSNNQLPGPKGCAQHGWFPSLLPAMPGRRLQLNRSATPTYVSTRGTTLGNRGTGQEGEFDVCQGGKEGEGRENVPGFSPSTKQPARYSAKRLARGKIFCFT